MSGRWRAFVVFGVAGGTCYALLYLLYLRGGTGLSLGLLLLVLTTATPALLGCRVAALMRRDAARAHNRTDLILRGCIAGAVLSIGAAILTGILLCFGLELGRLPHAPSARIGAARTLAMLVWGGLLGAYCSQFALPFGAVAGAVFYARANRSRLPLIQPSGTSPQDRPV